MPYNPEAFSAKTADAVRAVAETIAREVAGLPLPVDPDSPAAIARTIAARNARRKAEDILLAHARQQEAAEDAARFEAIKADRTKATMKDLSWANNYATTRAREALAAKRASMTDAERKAEADGIQENVNLMHRAIHDGDEAARWELAKRREGARIARMRAELAEIDGTE